MMWEYPVYYHKKRYAEKGEECCKDKEANQHEPAQRTFKIFITKREDQEQDLS